jgi:putative RNA 2'-phosphotransferase
MNKKETQVSRFLSLVLRHQPEVIGLALDENGWADTSGLIEKINRQGYQIDLETLKHIVSTNSKQRFVFGHSFEKIRANQGHSINIELDLETREPPTILFHGTAQQFVKPILEQGLKRQGRQHVHLSKDLETAYTVGRRHGSPIILEVRANEMFQDGFKFFLSENGVWLTDNVPAQYLILRNEQKI